MAVDPEDTLVYLAVSVQGVDLATQVTYVEVEDNDRLIAETLKQIELSKH